MSVSSFTQPPPWGRARALHTHAAGGVGSMPLDAQAMAEAIYGLGEPTLTAEERETLEESNGDVSFL